MAAGGEFPDGLDEEIDEHMRAPSGENGQALRRLGDPLLVSVARGRSLDARDDGHDPQHSD